jgi:hypothetical protein
MLKKTLILRRAHESTSLARHGFGAALVDVRGRCR